jgi:hypothetical protein
MQLSFVRGLLKLPGSLGKRRDKKKRSSVEERFQFVKMQ